MLFELSYKHVRPDGYPSEWTQFDFGQKYSFNDAIARIEKCSFSGLHYVKIVRDGEVIFQEAATTKEAVEFMRNHGIDATVNRLSRANDRNNNVSV